MTDSIAKLSSALNQNQTPTAGLPLGGMPLGGLYGVVKSIQNTTPPTLTITLAGSSTNVAGVRFFRRYQPVVGDTVMLGQLGSDFVVIDALMGYPSLSARMYAKTVTTSVVSGSVNMVPITFDTKTGDVDSWDPAGMCTVSAVNNTGSSCKITVPVAGLWLAKWCAQSSNSTSAGETFSRIFKNPTFSGQTITSTYSRSSNRFPDTSGQSGPAGVSSIRCAANDILVIALYQSSGGTITTVTGNDTYFEVDYLGPGV